MNFPHKLTGAERSEVPPYWSFLVWLLFASVLLFIGFVLVREGLWERVLEADQSKISILIVAVFVAASCYVAVQLFKVCGLFEHTLELLGQRPGAPARAGLTLVDHYLREMGRLPHGERAGGIDQPSYVFEIYVDKLRGPLEIVGFWSDTLIRLGLIGTIVGFIMMLQSFVSGPSPSEENIQTLLITMSKGMGTALYTTFAGLVASTLLGLQQQLLSRTVENVIAGLIRLSDRDGVIPGDISHDQSQMSGAK